MLFHMSKPLHKLFLLPEELILSAPTPTTFKDLTALLKTPPPKHYYPFQIRDGTPSFIAPLDLALHILPLSNQHTKSN